MQLFRTYRFVVDQTRKRKDLVGNQRPAGKHGLSCEPAASDRTVTGGPVGHMSTQVQLSSEYMLGNREADLAECVDHSVEVHVRAEHDLGVRYVWVV